ncbi:MAG: MBG domain-containing protein, partial [Gammaproteobacteria bacterium]|nr:MBG domain-containing protein [Gammaproteobacteria bacterium]
PYSIVASLATGGTFNPANYSISYTNGALTVNPASLTVAANNANKTYGQTVTFTGSEFTPTGLQNSETIGSVSLTSAGAINTANVGSSPYSIVASLATGGTFNPANYSISYTNGALTVNPASLTVAANNANKTYGQTVTFSGSEFTPTGLQNSETIGSVNLTSAGAISTANVSSSPYSIVASLATGGTFNPANYSISYTNGNLTVNPATLTYTANQASRFFGAENPAFSGTVSGFVLGQTQSTATTGVLAFITAATVSSNAGQYAINGSGLTANLGNYIFTQAAKNASALTINPVSPPIPNPKPIPPVPAPINIPRSVIVSVISQAPNHNTYADTINNGLRNVSITVNEAANPVSSRSQKTMEQPGYINIESALTHNTLEEKAKENEIQKMGIDLQKLRRALPLSVVSINKKESLFSKISSGLGEKENVLTSWKISFALSMIILALLLFISTLGMVYIVIRIKNIATDTFVKTVSKTHAGNYIKKIKH